jgi:hypothetical protein
MPFVTFMRSTSGRALRIVAGLLLIVMGLVVIGGAAGVVVSVVGLVPLAAGTFNFCLLGPVLGVDLRGRSKAHDA